MDKRGLVVESGQNVCGGNCIRRISRRIGSVVITDITTMYKMHSDNHMGRYITLEGDAADRNMTALAQRALMQFLPDRGRLLAVGLGNPDITYDRLGAAVIRTLTARRGRQYSLCAVETDVAARTGIESARLVRAALREMKADCVIVFDALSCQTPQRIGKAVQITDMGLVPASGVTQDDAMRMGLTRETLGVPIVAVGVPMMTVLSTITASSEDNAFHITSSDADAIVKIWAEILGGAMDLIVG